MNPIVLKPLTKGQKVEVYYNLHKHVFSVKDVKSKRVIAYTPSILLQNVIFKVSEAQRQKVLQTKQKNVHARVKGEFLSFDSPDNIETYQPAYYNPYKTSHFINFHTGDLLHTASFVFCQNKRIFYT